MDVEDLRLAVYRAFAETASVLGRAARLLGDGARTLWWGGCAWDSFALPNLLPGEDEVLVPAARMWDDVVHTCAHQRLFCSEDCAASVWPGRSGAYNPAAARLISMIAKTF